MSSDVNVSELDAPIALIAAATRWLLALLALLAQGAAAATIAISLASHPDAIAIEGRVDLDADAETAWRVLTDYERYVDFIPDLQGSRIVARNGATVLVEQTGDVMLWRLHLPLDVTFEITEMAPTSLTSRVVAGDLRALNSRYVLTPLGSGVRLEYTGKLGSGFALFGTLERNAVKQNVARRFQALADEIERRSAANRARSGGLLPLKGGGSSRVLAASLTSWA
jgi:ribosome-associated toxin RatA of RatAB toxin-antitoxin module